MRPFSIERPILFTLALSLLALSLLALGLTAPTLGQAQDAEEMCRAEEATLDKHGYLRAL